MLRRIVPVDAANVPEDQYEPVVSFVAINRLSIPLYSNGLFRLISAAQFSMTSQKSGAYLSDPKPNVKLFFSLFSSFLITTRFHWDIFLRFSAKKSRRRKNCRNTGAPHPGSRDLGIPESRPKPRRLLTKKPFFA